MGFSKMCVIKVFLFTILLGPALGLFKDEIFIFDGKEMIMPNKFTITLNKIHTVPQRLALSTMCQVPSFQLQQFSNYTGIPLTEFEVFSKRSTGSLSCTGVKYCDNGGMAGAVSLCLGTVHTLTDANCMSEVYNNVLNAISDMSTMILDGTKELAITMVDATMNEILKQMVTTINGTEKILQSAISSTELMLITSIQNASELNMKVLKETAESVASQASAVMDKLQNSINRRFDIVESSLQNLAISNSVGLHTLYNALRDTSAFNANRLQNLSNYVNDVVSAINKNNLASYLNMLSVSKVVQQLLSKLERVHRFELQGVDISPLLGRWENTDKSNIFQSHPQSYYTYYTSGIFGLYTEEDYTDMGYLLSREIVGSRVYRCYEKGEVSSEVPIIYKRYISAWYDLPGANETEVLYYANLGIRGFVQLMRDKCWYYDNLYGTKYFDFVQSDKINLLDLISIVYYYHNDVYRLIIYKDVETLTLWAKRLNSATERYDCYTNISSDMKQNIDDILNGNIQPRPDSVNITASDGGRWFHVICRDCESLNSIRPAITTHTFIRDRVERIGLGITRDDIVPLRIFNTTLYLHETNDQVLTSTYYGKDALVDHPEFGIINIHRCEMVRSSAIGNTINIYDMNGIHLGGADHEGRLVPSGVNVGIKYAIAHGLGDETVQLLTTSEMLPPMDTEKYYYTRDIWCCDNISRPKFTVSNGADCESLGYAICPSIEYAYCNGRLTPIENGKCILYPTHNPQGNYREIRYKSPRIYFCSQLRRYSEPYGIDLVPCEKGTIMLPGAGVEIQTGTISPEGLYPAACIYYSVVHGTIPLYTISARFENEVVPVMISSLDGKKVLYAQYDGKVVDEMDRLYGVGNSGYDCVNYEMDRFLHQPRACLSYNIPEYDMVAYFSGKVRSSGLSKLLDYFDIIPRPGDSPDILYMDFILKDGIDYESAYINNLNLCPKLSVSYVTIDNIPRCELSGWTDKDTNLTVAGSKVCTSVGVCDLKKTVTDNTTLDIIVDNGEEQIICNRFQCKAGIRSFVAYPVDTFSAKLQRPHLSSYLGSQAGYNYAAELQNLLNMVSKTLTENTFRLNVTGLGKDTINTTITVTVNSPDLTAIINNIKSNFTLIREQISDTYKAIIDAAEDDISKIRHNISNTIEMKYNEISENISKYIEDAMIPISEYTEEKSKTLTDIVGLSKVAKVLGPISIVLSILSLAISLITLMRGKIMRRLKLRRGSKTVEMDKVEKD